MDEKQARALLAEYRGQIDTLDLEILALINRRTEIVERIGQVKQACHMPIYEPRREDEVYRNVTTHNPGPLPPEGVQRVFERIIDVMRVVQKQRMDASASNGNETKET